MSTLMFIVVVCLDSSGEKLADMLETPIQFQDQFHRAKKEGMLEGVNINITCGLIKGGRG